MADLVILFKMMLCVFQVICLYQVLVRNRNWPVPFMLIVAILSMSI